MKKKHVVTIIIICGLIAFFTGRAILNQRDYVSRLEALHQREMHEWVINQRTLAYRLDTNIAEALAAPDEKTLGKALSDAYDTAHEGRELLWRPSLINEVNVALDRWRFRAVYGDTYDYLYYLINKDSNFPLTTVEVKNLEVIRSYSEVFVNGFSEVIPHIQYEEETDSGMKTLKYHPWKEIIKDKGIISKLNDMGSDFNILPLIGDGDKRYREYKDLRRSESNFEYGLKHSNEEVFEDEVLIERAEAFLKDLAIGDLTEPSPPSEPYTGKTNVGESSGHGGDLVGEYIHHTVEDKDTNTIYEMDITNIGSHIAQLQLNQKNSKLSSIEEAIELGEELLDKWMDYERVSVELIQNQWDKSRHEVYFVYAVVEEDVIVNNKTVTLAVALGENKNLGINMDAFKYFDTYSYPLNYTPELTPEEAITLLSPQLTATKEPSLEIKRGTFTLVYNIPVEGVKWVDKVYINAVTGEYEGMEYDYSRP